MHMYVYIYIYMVPLMLHLVYVVRSHAEAVLGADCVDARPHLTAQTVIVLNSNSNSNSISDS